MGAKSEFISSLFDRLRLFALIAVIFGILSFFSGIFLVTSTCCSSFEYYFSDFFASLGGIFMVLPFTLGFCLLLIYFVGELVKKNKPKIEFDASLSKNLLKGVIILALFNVFLLLIFLTGNPHKFAVATCPDPPGPPVIFDFWGELWYNCPYPDITYEFFTITLILGSFLHFYFRFL